MKLSVYIDEAIDYERLNDDYWTETFIKWKEYAEWLEESVEGEGASSDMIRSIGKCV